MAQITKEALLEKLFQNDYEELKGKRLRLTRVRVPGKEVCMAHVISRSDTCIYENLALHIGVHEGEDHTGESIGLIRFTPWESVVAAADIAVKRGRRDWIYGSVLRDVDFAWEFKLGADRSGRSRKVF